METSISSSLLPSIGVDVSSNKQDVIRHTVNFSASMWGEQFLTPDEVQLEDLVMEKQVIEELKEKVRKELIVKASSNASMLHKKLMELIDAIQRLGVAYHFEEEIGEALQHIYVTYGEKWTDQNNLQSISLWFRLLRQQGFNVSSGIFKNHMDDKGNFKESLCEDAQGMLALYEASYMRVEGEKVLDDALEFTKTHLAIIAKDPSCGSLLRTQIQQALKQPLRKRLPRIEAVHYMPIYQQEASHNEVLLKLAKLDFNLLQSMHKEELRQLCKWWKDLDMQQKLPYVRDRLIEGYFWILGVYYEPHHSRTRIFLLKTSMWLIVLDDTYDNYGTYEELKIFTDAVERWSMSYIDTLPEYMKLIYQELLSHHQEMEEELEKEGKAYQIPYVIEMAKDIIQNNLLEAKWLKEGYMPSLEEYISVSMKTCTYGVMIARAYVGRSDNLVNEDTFKWVGTYPPIVKAACLVLRLMDDVTTHEEEQERGHVASSIECYQKETGASEKEACKFISNKVEDAWKVINRDSLRPTEIPFPLLTPIINYARACDILYKVNDGYTHAGKETINHIKSILVHPVPTEDSRSNT
ncbi:(E)-beta-farnesene synthase-like [Bidens hawaiensis]|uniref:(E)-beta-farnesene synthase-like n=1 Tax=Bidens hawaiensis TaxID=980011 RepID=UPI00404A1E4D